MAELLRGRLAAFRLPTLLQAAEGELLNGVLSVFAATAEPAGTVSFGRGRVVAARCGRLDGLDGLAEVFLCGGDAFVVEDGPPTDARPLGDTLGLVMEGCRIADDWDRHRTSVLEARGPAPDRLAALWPHLDGRRSLERALRGLDRGRAPFVAGLDEALHSGALRVVGQATQPVVTDFDEAMKRGREALRSRAYADAIDWFGEGVRLRPDDRAAQQNLRHVQQLVAGGARAVAFR